jgi:hypothetical protein
MLYFFKMKLDEQPSKFEKWCIEFQYIEIQYFYYIYYEHLKKWLSFILKIIKKLRKRWESSPQFFIDMVEHQWC